MRAMVLAAGLGTRLRPITEEIPKPAVPIANVPLAAIAVRRLAAVGVTDVVLNAHHLADVLEARLEPFVPSGVHVEIVREPRLLGTGGGVRAALAAQAARLGPPEPHEPILLVNGDVLFAPDLGAALAHHRALGAVATMVLREDPRAEAAGPIEVDAGGRVRRILRRPAWDGGPLEVRMFTGVHVLSGRALADLPEEGCIIRRAYAGWLESGAIVAGLTERAPFRDCGTPGELLGAMRDVLEGRIAVPGVSVDAGAVVDPGAEVEGAKIERSCVAAGARVAPGVELEDCLVLSGADVRVSARRAIFSAAHRLDG